MAVLQVFENIKKSDKDENFRRPKKKKQHSKVTVKTGLYNQRIFNRLLLMTVDR